MSESTASGPRPPLFARSTQGYASEAITEGDFQKYRNALVHEWLLTLTLLVVILVPLFFVLDFFTMPRALIPRFALYRISSMMAALVQYLIVRGTKPGDRSLFHGYFVSFQVGLIIVLMTSDLGGFNSSYYAGLNLVIIGVNLLMPWKAFHTAINAALIFLMYMGVNLASGKPFEQSLILNNLFFMAGSAVIAVSINNVRYTLIEREFSLLVDLKKARDGLWSEMEIAKKIQTALLPQGKIVRGFDAAVTMLPAKEVGGDYLDIIETEDGERWIAIGDVAGHGVDSGLIMMMAQASIMTVIRGKPNVKPIDVLRTTNLVIKEDITRLGSNHYMTLMVIKLDDDRLTVAGHHQDILVYNAKKGAVSAFKITGTWLGITDQIASFMKPRSIKISENDVILLFTDGVTEGTDASGEMFGQKRLADALAKNAGLSAEEILGQILEEVRYFQVEQDDDMTLIVLKKKPGNGRQ